MNRVKENLCVNGGGRFTFTRSTSPGNVSLDRSSTFEQGQAYQIFQNLPHQVAAVMSSACFGDMFAVKDAVRPNDRQILDSEGKPEDEEEDYALAGVQAIVEIPTEYARRQNPFDPW
ncbi:hypothetical protein AXG93_1877s1110 [Marchantia polymorpha subsp. ruderalis]|uniref:Uncharacterized protein n=1 Tax=Marchantia polymorpha subsp. ruderalis TaxID=1480154 RepID=A0A176VRP5_MARPO|nr:hypothetical protein AXG93_1877s1110 [Marchantia polymorpha subsp. ruderalis]